MGFALRVRVGVRTSVVPEPGGGGAGVGALRGEGKDLSPRHRKGPPLLELVRCLGRRREPVRRQHRPNLALQPERRRGLLRRVCACV